MEPFYKDIGWESGSGPLSTDPCGHRPTSGRPPRLLRAPCTRPRWILHSGSVEHLCLLHLVRSRVARGEATSVWRSSGWTRVASLGNLNCGCITSNCCASRQRSTWSRGTPAPRRHPQRRPRSASARAAGSRVAAEAGHLLGQALARLHRNEDARAVLDETLAAATSGPATRGDGAAAEAPSLIHTLWRPIANRPPPHSRPAQPRRGESGALPTSR
jgi:hypothetical protein